MRQDPRSSRAREILRDQVHPRRHVPTSDRGASERRGGGRDGSGSPAPAPDPPAPAGGRWRRAVEEWIRASTRGRLWWVRAPLIPVLAWIAWRHAGDIWWGSIFGGINLAFHEIGHVLFSVTGSELLTVAGGTIVELAIPLVAAALLARQRDAFGVGVALFWWGTAFASVGRYIYDTRSQIGGRVSIGPAAGPDDWTYLLSRWDLIRQDRVIGMTVKEVGVAVMAAALAWCCYTVWRMARDERGRG